MSFRLFSAVGFAAYSTPEMKILLIFVLLDVLKLLDFDAMYQNPAGLKRLF